VQRIFVVEQHGKQGEAKLSVLPIL
jgi:hypothetical protein